MMATHVIQGRSLYLKLRHPTNVNKHTKMNTACSTVLYGISIHRGRSIHEISSAALSQFE